MNRLMKFEYRKLVRRKSTYICFGLTLFMLVVYALIEKSFSEGSFFFPEGILISGSSCALNAIENGMLSALGGIFVAIYAAEDYSNDTFKNIYAKGYSREQVYLSKYFATLIIMAVCALILILTGFCLGEALKNDESVINSDFILCLLLQLLTVLAYHSVYFFVAMSTGHTGISVAFCLVGPGLILMAFEMAGMIMELKDFYPARYWLDDVTVQLESGTVNGELVSRCLILCAIYIIVPTVLGIIINKKKEF